MICVACNSRIPHAKTQRVTDNLLLLPIRISDKHFASCRKVSDSRMQNIFIFADFSNLHVVSDTFWLFAKRRQITLKVHKIENFFDSDCGICVISLLVMHK
jgi:hypothetical protein